MSKRGYRIIDSDMHVMEPPDLWLRYIDDRFKDRAPRVGEIDGSGRPRAPRAKAFRASPDHPGRAAVKRARTDQDHPKFTRYADARARGYDAQSQLEAMDVEGVDVAVLFRTMGGHVIAIDDMDADLAAAMCRAFNRWLADHCAADPDRLKATAVVPLHDVGLAVREAEYAVGELGHVAIVLPSNPVKKRSWYDPAYDPIWQAACDLGGPVAVHGVQGAYQEHLANRYLESLVMMHASAHPLELMLAMGGLICGGAFDRFPDLKAGFLEGTCAWVQWWLWRLDDDWEKLGHAERVQLQAKPSEYFSRHCYVAVEPGEALVTQVIDVLGDDNLVISTDWPHDDSSYPDAMSNFLAIEGLSGESKKKILWDNCARLYGL